MSTVPGLIPVAVVAFPTDPTEEHFKQIMQQIAPLRLPIVALLPDDSPCYRRLNESDDFHTVIRNTHPEDPFSYLRFRLNSLDLINRHTNMEIAGVMEFDYKYSVVWEGIPRFQTQTMGIISGF